jgi:hypothetical protein
MPINGTARMTRSAILNKHNLRRVIKTNPGDPFKLELSEELEI